MTVEVECVGKVAIVIMGVMTKSNAEQVEKIVSIARVLSLEPATPDEARENLNLKGLDKVNF